MEINSSHSEVKNDSDRPWMSRVADRYVSFDHCHAVLPWFQFARNREAMPRLRNLALRLEAAEKDLRPPNFIIAAFIHLPVSLRQIWITFRRYSRPVRKTFRVSLTRQLVSLFHLSWRLNQPPHDYYLQKMWLRPDRRTWAQFVQQREHVLLVRELQRTLPIAQFDDKLNFFRRMKAADVPTIEVLRAASAGRWLDGFPDGVTEENFPRDLVIKPTDGTMYDGVEIWHYGLQPATYTRHLFTKVNEVEEWVSDENLDLAGLLDRVLGLSATRTYIVQPFMRNNPELEPISPRLIANFRIVTAMRDGQVRVIAAIIRMGYDNRKFISGTYQANIDLETGVLGFATGRDFQWGFGENHLETGHRVKDRRIEHWPQLKAIAVRGHEQYPWMPTIGWDAIDSDHGPMLMEANAFWGVDISQLDCPFLGETGYAEAILEALDRESKSVRETHVRQMAE